MWQGQHPNHIGVCNAGKLDAAGQYCTEVVGIPHLGQRISSFIFVRQFGDNLDRVSTKGHLTCIRPASAFVWSVRMMQQVRLKGMPLHRGRCCVETACPYIELACTEVDGDLLHHRRGVPTCHHHPHHHETIASQDYVLPRYVPTWLAHAYR